MFAAVRGSKYYGDIPGSKMDMEYSKLGQRGHKTGMGTVPRSRKDGKNEKTIPGEALAAIVKTVLFVAGGLVGGLGTGNCLSWG